jgi:hypothetical protein
MNIEDIKTVEDWKQAMGTGFRLTKDEKGRNMSREEALAERVSIFQAKQGNRPGLRTVEIIEREGKSSRAARSRKGDILIRIRPQADVDPAYFAQLDGKQLEVVLDEKWYSWLDTKLEAPYNGDVQRLVSHILDLGLGEVITRIQTEKDIETT